MRKPALAMLSVPVLVLLASSAVAPRGTAEIDPRDLAGRATIGLGAAIEQALAARPGAAVEADLEADGDAGAPAVFIEVMIVAQDGLYEVKIDAEKGGVLGNAKVDEAEELEELSSARRALRHTELGLAAIVAKAGAIIQGTPVGASLELDDDGPECEVSIAHGRYLIEAVIEGRAGHLIGLSLEEDHGDEHDGEEHDGDEHHGDEHHGDEHDEDDRG